MTVDPQAGVSGIGVEVQLRISSRDGEKQTRVLIPYFVLIVETTSNEWHTDLTRARSRNLPVAVYYRSC
jgi:hypothetical protein